MKLKIKEAHGGEGVEGKWGSPYVPTSKEFEKSDHKNALKHEYRGPPARFSHNSK